MSSYRALYAKEAPAIPHYFPGESSIDDVDSTLFIREEILEQLKSNLEKSQARMKIQVDKGEMWSL